MPRLITLAIIVAWWLSSYEFQINSNYCGISFGLATFYPNPTFSKPLRNSNLWRVQFQYLLAAHLITSELHGNDISHPCTSKRVCIFQVGEGVGFAYQTQTSLSLLTWSVKPPNNQDFCINGKPINFLHHHFKKNYKIHLNPK